MFEHQAQWNSLSLGISSWNEARAKQEVMIDTPAAGL